LGHPVYCVPPQSLRRRDRSCHSLGKIGYSPWHPAELANGGPHKSMPVFTSFPSRKHAFVKPARSDLVKLTVGQPLDGYIATLDGLRSFTCPWCAVPSAPTRARFQRQFPPLGLCGAKCQLEISSPRPSALGRRRNACGSLAITRDGKCRCHAPSPISRRKPLWAPRPCGWRRPAMDH
jgi:hypothetical protein